MRQDGLSAAHIPPPAPARPPIVAAVNDEPCRVVIRALRNAAVAPMEVLDLVAGGPGLKHPMRRPALIGPRDGLRITPASPDGGGSLIEFFRIHHPLRTSW